jgi:Kef-type K+ transport system membrane component KefB
MCAFFAGGFTRFQGLVQVETLGQFGVLFIMFVLGIEFSFEKMTKDW